jgi:c-di-GMP-binding flagellar brake protein YcgR
MSAKETDRDSAEVRAESINVEWGMPLMIRIEGLSESIRSAVVGMERGVYLICDAPAVPGLWAKLRDHNQIIVRYVHRGAVYGFRCTLLSLMNEPFRLMVVSYPDNIEVIKLRKQDRVPCLAAASLELNGMTFKGLARDITMEGCGIAFSNTSEDRLLELTPPIEAALAIQLLGSQVKAGVEVVNIRKYHGKVIVGSLFKDPGSDALDDIRAYIATIADLGAGSPETS